MKWATEQFRNRSKEKQGNETSSVPAVILRSYIFSHTHEHRRDEMRHTVSHETTESQSKIEGV